MFWKLSKPLKKFLCHGFREPFPISVRHCTSHSVRRKIAYTQKPMQIRNMTDFTCTSRVPCDIDGRRSVSRARERERLDAPSETRAALSFLPSWRRWWWRPEVGAFCRPVTSRDSTARSSYSTSHVVVGNRLMAASAWRHPCPSGYTSVRPESCLTRLWRRNEAVPRRQRTDRSAGDIDRRRWPFWRMRVIACSAASSVAL